MTSVASSQTLVNSPIQGTLYPDKEHVSRETRFSDPISNYNLRPDYINHAIIMNDSNSVAPLHKESKKSNPQESVLHKNLRLATTLPVARAMEATAEEVRKAGVVDLGLAEELDITKSSQQNAEDALLALKDAQKRISKQELALTNALFASYLRTEADPKHLQRYGPFTPHTPVPDRVLLELRNAVKMATVKAQQEVFSTYIKDEDQLKTFMRQYNDIITHKACNRNEINIATKNLGETLRNLEKARKQSAAGGGKNEDASDQKPEVHLDTLKVPAKTVKGDTLAVPAIINGIS